MYGSYEFNKPRTQLSDLFYGMTNTNDVIVVASSTDERHAHFGEVMLNHTVFFCKRKRACFTDPASSLSLSIVLDENERNWNPNQITASPNLPVLFDKATLSSFSGTVD